MTRSTPSTNQVQFPSASKLDPFVAVARVFAPTNDNLRNTQGLTEFQQRVFDLIMPHGENGLMPTLGEIADLLRLKSENNVSSHLDNIERTGSIARLLRKNNEIAAACEPMSGATVHDTEFHFMRIPDFGLVSNGQKNVARICTKLFRKVPRSALPAKTNDDDFFIISTKNEDLRKTYEITETDMLIFNRRLPNDSRKGVFVLINSNRGELSIKYLNRSNNLLYSVMKKKNKNVSLHRPDLSSRSIRVDRVSIIGWLHGIPILPNDARKEAIAASRSDAWGGASGQGFGDESELPEHFAQILSNLTGPGQDEVTGRTRLAALIVRRGKSSARVNCTRWETDRIVAMYDFVLDGKRIEGRALIDGFATNPDDMVYTSPAIDRHSDAFWDLYENLLEIPCLPDFPLATS